MTHQTTRRRFLQGAGLGAASIGLAGMLPSAFAADAPVASPSSKVKFQLGMASYSLRNFSLAQAVKMTAGVGLKFICLKSFHLPMDADDEQLRAAAKTCADGGVLLYGCGVLTMRSPEAVDQAFHYAKTAGMTRIIGVPGEDVLPMVERKVKETGIEVAIHNHGPGDKLYPTPQVVCERIKGLDPRIGCCIDIGHVARLGLDPVEAIKAAGDRVLDMHLKDVTKAEASGHSCPAGEGVIDMEAVLKTMVEIGFAGIASFEYEAEPDNPMPGIEKSVEVCREIMATL